LLTLILLETLVIRHFLTLVAQQQQAVVGRFALLSMVVEILIPVGGLDACNTIQHQQAQFKTLDFLQQLPQ
jgi:hypothetical protein